VHVVIMGCGRLGSTLAGNLESRGHSVAVIDQNSDAFRRLGSEFSGITVTGVGFDRDVLRAAGIERADAFAAVSSGDNSNIISARLARETFGVSRVVARIYDARRAQVYERLGIPATRPASSPSSRCRCTATGWAARSSRWRPRPAPGWRT
jgi:trk system potassium uptake protein TrkA